MVGSVQFGLSPTVRGRVCTVWYVSYCVQFGMVGSVQLVCLLLCVVGVQFGLSPSLTCLLLCVVGSVQFGLSPTVRGRVCIV